MNLQPGSLVGLTCKVTMMVATWPSNLDHTVRLSASQEVVELSISKIPPLSGIGDG